MKAVAIKKDQPRDNATADFQAMGILRCDTCLEDFVICHSPGFVDKAAADRQAHWLEKVLAEEHGATRSTPTGLNCRIDPGKSGRLKWLTKLFDVHIARKLTVSGQCCSGRAGLSASGAAM